MSVGVDELMQSLVPPPRVSSADWLRDNFYTHDGRAFDEWSVPWVTAPQGPCWAADNPQFRRIWLQWAARMFKTTFAQGLMMMQAELDPCTMMFATVDEGNCKSVFGRLWRMISECPPLRHECPPLRLRAKTHIRLHRSEIYGAWPRGKSRLADKSVRVGHANEIDKWEHASTSTEGDPLPRFLKRLDEWPDSKAVLESTPADRNHSRVETGRLRSTNHRYHVPCPHCGNFQVLVKGDGKEPPGLFWERGPGGSDPDVALRTAYYVCAHCKSDIHDIHKPQMIHSGVWIPDGCTPDHDRCMRARELPPDDTSWMRGEPTRWSEDYGSQLSVLYAMFQGWGVFASRWVAAAKRKQLRRQLVTEDLAETWENVAREQTWEQLGRRLMGDDPAPHKTVPAGCSLLTAGIDKQLDHYVYVVDAWGPDQRCWTIDYGECDTAAELQAVLTDKYPRAEGGESLRVSAALIDSGYKPRDAASFVTNCRRHRIRIQLCKGASKPLHSAYRKTRQGKDSATPGQMLVLVDTWISQDWIESQLHDSQAGEPGGLGLYKASLMEHQDFLEQLLNDAPLDKLDGANNQKLVWNRVDEAEPNDYRDAKRYSNVAMLVHTKGRQIRQPSKPKGKEAKKPRRRPSPMDPLQRPGGWAADFRRG